MCSVSSVKKLKTNGLKLIFNFAKKKNIINQLNSRCVERRNIFKK